MAKWKFNSFGNGKRSQRVVFKKISSLQEKIPLGKVSV
jgi:hypothetical protein